jgi:hypothetical protein
MNPSVIESLQDEARQAYDRLPGLEASAFLQSVMLAEIALQLASINEQQQKQNDLLLRLCIATEMLENLK